MSEPSDCQENANTIILSTQNHLPPDDGVAGAAGERLPAKLGASDASRKRKASFEALGDDSQTVSKGIHSDRLEMMKTFVRFSVNLLHKHFTSVSSASASQTATASSQRCGLGGGELAGGRRWRLRGGRGIGTLRLALRLSLVERSVLHELQSGTACKW